MIKKIIRNLIYKFNLIDRQVQNTKCIVRKQYLEDKILNCHELGVTSTKYCDHDIIVSLTSYGRRLNSVCYAIESIMQQIKKANRIILWLGDKDFEGTIPASLEQQTKRGLEIRRTKDIRSYTKIIPSIKEFPNSAIVTIDDDIMYDFDILGNIIDSYLKNLNCIHACRCHVIKYKTNGVMYPYNEWKWGDFDQQNNYNNFFTGVGGVLYPPNCFDSEVLNEKVFLDICATADDVWLNAMARKNGTKICKVPTKTLSCEDFVELQDVQAMGLFNSNVIREGNDPQINAVFEKYLY